jgi:hypothetical protein
MFTKATDDDEPQQLKKFEKVAPSDKMKNTFQKYVTFIFVLLNKSSKKINLSARSIL